jgi:hypothetical protein
MDRESREKVETGPKPPLGEARPPAAEPRAIGGPKASSRPALAPTRYGDGEYDGSCIDF